MKCTLDHAGPLGLGEVWPHDLSPEQPTFRFKFELLARVQYLESQLASMTGKGGAPSGAVPADEYKRLQQKVWREMEAWWAGGPWGGRGWPAGPGRAG